MDAFIVLSLFGLAIVLFVTELFRIDFVALIILAALLLFGVVTPAEGIAGFSNPATVTVGAMFILSAGLQRTGIVRAIGRKISLFGTTRNSLLLLFMLVVGFSSAFINNTGVVAVFLPLAIASAQKRKFASSKLLIPISFASQAAGVCTLIGTSTNILVSSISDQYGYGAFSMFELGQVGIFLFIATFIFFMTVGQYFLPSRTGHVLEEYVYVAELIVPEGSPLVDVIVRESELLKEHEVAVVKLIRDSKRLSSPHQRKIQAGDILLVEGKVSEWMALKDHAKLEIREEGETHILAAAIIAPQSSLIGQTLKSWNFEGRYRASVLAVRRRETNLDQNISSIRFRMGDELILQGKKEEIDKLRGDPALVLLDELSSIPLQVKKAPIALAIIAAIVIAASLNIIPIVAGAIIGCVAMVLTGCLKVDDLSKAIDWKVIFLIAGILPLGTAMATSGAAELITTQAVSLVGGFGPYAILAVFYILTALLTEAMSNNAAAVLLAPIGFYAALEIGVSPKPFFVAVAIAASTSFATPIGYQTNTMIFAPGGYKFTDFFKVGAPLNMIFFVISMILIPYFWPF